MYRIVKKNYDRMDATGAALVQVLTEKVQMIQYEISIGGFDTIEDALEVIKIQDDPEQYSIIQEYKVTTKVDITVEVEDKHRED